MTRALFASMIAFLLLTLPSCQKEDPEVPNEEEVITKLVYTLTPRAGGTAVMMTFSDMDGDGGNAPVVTGGTLQANTTYDGVITLFNEQETPVENIHEEVMAEDEEHQFFFPNTLGNVSVTYADQDADGNPLGLKTTLMTGAAETGELTVILKHEPTKTATQDATNNGVAAGGETDIEVTFNVTVQ